MGKRFRGSEREAKMLVNEGCMFMNIHGPEVQNQHSGTQAVDDKTNLSNMMNGGYKIKPRPTLFCLPMLLRIDPPTVRTCFLRGTAKLVAEQGPLSFVHLH